MISVYKIKPKFQKLLRPILEWLYSMNITANQITIFSILYSIGLGALFLWTKTYSFILIVFALGLLLRMALNALDGMMARQYNMQSKLGEVLNEVGDIVSDLVIIVPLVILPHINPYIIIVFAILSLINEFAGLLGKAIGGERRYEGPMGKSDRALIIGVYSIILYFWSNLNIYSNIIFSCAIILVLISTITRLKNSIK